MALSSRGYAQTPQCPTGWVTLSPRCRPLEARPSGSMWQVWSKGRCGEELGDSCVCLLSVAWAWARRHKGEALAPMNNCCFVCYSPVGLMRASPVETGDLGSHPSVSTCKSWVLDVCTSSFQADTGGLAKARWRRRGRCPSASLVSGEDHSQPLHVCELTGLTLRRQLASVDMDSFQEKPERWGFCLPLR